MSRKPSEKPDAVVDWSVEFLSEAASTHDAPEDSAFGGNRLIAARLRKGFREFDFITPPVAHSAQTGRLSPPDATGVRTTHRWLSDVPKLMMKENSSLPVRKCIYERLPYSARDGGFERMLIESLEADGRVSAHCRLHWAHHVFFHLHYEEENGAMAICHPDFLVRTGHAVYMVETGAPPPLTRPDVQHRLKAAAAWCKQINLLDPLLRGGLPWHYVLLLEEAFRSWRGKGAFPSDLLAFARLRSSEGSPASHEQITASPSGEPGR